MIVGPFWFPDMLDNVGLSGSAGLMTGLIVAFAVLPVIFVQWKGKKIRERRTENELNVVNTITR